MDRLRVGVVGVGVCVRFYLLDLNLAEQGTTSSESHLQAAGL